MSLSTKTYVTHLFLIAVALSISCVQVSTISYEQDKRDAVSAANDFHQMFNEQKFEDIYASTDDQAKKTKSKEGLISILGSLRSERGAVTGSELLESKVETKALYREVYLTFRTKYDRSENVERFVWYVASNRKPTLYSYSTDP